MPEPRTLEGIRAKLQRTLIPGVEASGVNADVEWLIDEIDRVNIENSELKKLVLKACINCKFENRTSVCSIGVLRNNKYFSCDKFVVTSE
jgi:hypothetical protein